ncbi:MAG: hypothetical protein RMJ97_02340 [Raineya sp.]|nr:hypothetical protein [Raineya sp.]MDW8295699.1 hypothetical protein [Raineya sp.]
MKFEAIGLLPVLLALFSLLFLVVLLSYHTLKRTRKAMEENLENYWQALRQKAQVAIQLANLIYEKGDYLHSYDLVLKLCSIIQGIDIAWTERLRAEKSLQKEIAIMQELVRNITELSKDTTIQSKAQELQNLEKQTEALYRKYAYSLKYYNNFTQKIPSKWVAQIAGFRNASLQ